MHTFPVRGRSFGMIYLFYLCQYAYISSTWSFIWYDLLVLPLPICIHLHFSSLKGNCQNADQSTKPSILSCNDVVSSSVIIVRYNFVSSANILQLFFITSGKSFYEYNKKSRPYHRSLRNSTFCIDPIG